MRLGYSWDDIRFGMSVRTFHARLAAAYGATLQEQQMMTRAVSLGVGRLFAKKGADSGIDDAIDEQVQKLRDAVDDMLGDGDGEATSAMEGAAFTPSGAAPAPTASQAARAERRRQEQIVKNIAKLDTAMSFMTGRVHRNPAIHAAPGQVTPFDLKQGNLGDVLQRQ